MTLKINELSVLAYANKFTMWHYATTDDSVEGAGYFDGAADMLRVNDLIIANVDTDGGAPDTTFYIVTANTGSAVTIAAYA